MRSPPVLLRSRAGPPSQALPLARIAFIVTTCHEFEGVKVLSSVLKLHGHQADCFITSEEKNFYKAVLDWKPDVIAVYVTTGQELWAHDYIRRWKQELSHLKAVFGGPHSSHDEPARRRELPGRVAASRCPIRQGSLNYSPAHRE